MTALQRDRITGLTLLVVALAWTAASSYAISDGFSGSIYGPRAFPFWLGVLLAVLSLMMIASSFRGAHHLANPATSDVVDEAEGASFKDEMWAAAATFGFLVLLLISMRLFGFLFSTMVLAALFLWFVLGSRSVLLTVLLSAGLSLGVWYLMGRYLGVYLPAGLWGV